MPEQGRKILERDIEMPNSELKNSFMKKFK